MASSFLSSSWAISACSAHTSVPLMHMGPILLPSAPPSSNRCRVQHSQQPGQCEQTTHRPQGPARPPSPSENQSALHQHVQLTIAEVSFLKLWSWQITKKWRPEGSSQVSRSCTVCRQPGLHSPGLREGLQGDVLCTFPDRTAPTSVKLPLWFPVPWCTAE